MANWKHTLKLPFFHDEELGLEEKTDKIVDLIKKAKWFDEVNYNGELEDFLEELTDAGKEDNVDQFDAVWDYIYDIFDAHRIWVAMS